MARGNPNIGPAPWGEKNEVVANNLRCACQGRRRYVPGTREEIEIPEVVPNGPAQRYQGANGRGNPSI
jgi:hypothetical protein